MVSLSERIPNKIPLDSNGEKNPPPQGARFQRLSCIIMFVCFLAVLKKALHLSEESEESNSVIMFFFWIVRLTVNIVMKQLYQNLDVESDP